MRWIISCSFILFCIGCWEETSASRQFLFLGHPYHWIEAGNRVDPRVKALPLEVFDQIWLGGDVCAKTTADTQTLAYLKKVFPIEQGRVHWAWGNHDVKFGREAWLEAQLGKSSYYLDCQEEFCVLVLNTNLFQWPDARPDSAFCGQMWAQHQLVRSLPERVPLGHTLVVLHHYGLLTNAMTEGRYDLDTVFNFYKPQLKVHCQSDTATFEQAWYPIFQELQKKRSSQVVMVSGDLGMRAKKFAFQDENGLWFLGAGINNSVPEDYRPEYLTNFDPDQVLVFQWEPREGKLSWEFRVLK